MMGQFPNPAMAVFHVQVVLELSLDFEIRCFYLIDFTR